MQPKNIFLLILALTLFTTLSSAQVVINEGSNRNYSILPDEDGEFPDWVELYNAGTETVNLLNYTITDKLSNPAKWIFPDIQLLPGEYKTIFCSGKDRKPEDGYTDVLTTGIFSPLLGWNTHHFTTPFYWDGTSGILINTCSYNSVGYSSNSVFNQSETPYLSSVYAAVDGNPDACTAGYGTPVFQRPNLKLNGHTIGTGTIQNSNTAYPAPYGNWYWSARNQMLIPASELTAAGLTAGTISNLAFDVASTDPNTVYDYIAISMKLTTQSAVSSKFESAYPSAALHTNFKISETGETVYLFSPVHVLLSSLLVHCNDLDNSRGSFPDATSFIYLFQQGTPAGSNNQSPVYSGYLLAPSTNVASGYYETPFSVQLSNPNGANSFLYYTTDGSEPTTESYLYNGSPIVIFSTKVIKARAFQDGMLPSPAVVSTYFFGVDHTTPVLSVITANSNLYGDGGIFDNWWQDWERTAYVEYFDSTRQLIFSQRAGMQIDGGAGGSRSNPQHSFRIELADGVLGDGPVDYHLIPDRPARTTYSKFYLRNGSNQYLVLPYKDATQVTSMGKGTNNYYAAWRPVTVYINGEYFGLYELREKIDAEYYETLEGADPDNTTILSQSFWYGGVLRAVEGEVDPFYASWHAFTTLDPADPNFWDLADTHFDLTWYTDYIIGESWMGNTDWPWNNIKIYRSDATAYRWRYCLIDQELAMQPNGWTDYTTDHIAYMLGQDAAIPHISVWLKGIQNDRFRNYFINRFADQMNTSYRFSRISAIEQNMFSLTNHEMQHEYARWGDPNNIQEQMEAFTNNHLTLQSQFSQRTEQVRNHILANFNLTNTANITLDAFPAGAGKIRISTVTPDLYPWQGIYFNGIPVQITAEPGPGYFFSHWGPNSLIADTLNAVFSDTLNAESASFTAFFGEETIGVPILSENSSGFSLYPNPAEDLVYLSGNITAGMIYQVVDLNGHILLQGQLNPANASSAIDIGSLSPAVYIVRLQDPKNGLTQLRFIKVEGKR